MSGSSLAARKDEGRQANWRMKVMRSELLLRIIIANGIAFACALAVASIGAARASSLVL
jgi:hypothetical protein